MDLYADLERQVREKLNLPEDEKVFVFFVDKTGMLSEPKEGCRKLVFVGQYLKDWNEIFDVQGD